MFKIVLDSVKSIKVITKIDHWLKSLGTCVLKLLIASCSSNPISLNFDTKRKSIPILKEGRSRSALDPDPQWQIHLFRTSSIAPLVYKTAYTRVDTNHLKIWLCFIIIVVSKKEKYRSIPRHKTRYKLALLNQLEWYILTLFCTGYTSWDIACRYLCVLQD